MLRRWSTKTGRGGEGKFCLSHAISSVASGPRLSFRTPSYRRALQCDAIQQSSRERVSGHPPSRYASDRRFCVSRHSASPVLWEPRSVLFLPAFAPPGALRHSRRPRPFRRPPSGAPDGEHLPIPVRRVVQSSTGVGSPEATLRPASRALASRSSGRRLQLLWPQNGGRPVHQLPD
ncbi:hypothetical protein NDU88_002374 [Pleurodeles waltl]|uniref:Uncharacterized protein n=1 Tax=Pleurodeles waltl TaxID=8319 RepID=A0AAV7UCZ2_PLEWA|nr:hypothetical protein NDU88_002374 [Pleurodeles waltl]